MGFLTAGYKRKKEYQSPLNGIIEIERQLAGLIRTLRT